MHGENPGCTVLGEVHPVGAQNKTLISDTDSMPTHELHEYFLGLQITETKSVQAQVYANNM